MAVIPVPAVSREPAPDDIDTIPWFGVEIRIDPAFGECVYLDWVEEFGYLDEADPAAIAAGKTLMRRLVHEADFDEFWRLAVKHRQNNRDLSAVLRAVLDGLSGRPTVRSADSSVGPEQNEGESKVAFIKRVTAGRPDLEVGLMDQALRTG